jgi:hypothetical protein
MRRGAVYFAHLQIREYEVLKNAGKYRELKPIWYIEKQKILLRVKSFY